MAKNKHDKPKTRNRIIVLFLAAVVALFVVTQIVPGMVGALQGTEIIKYGELTISNDVTCYLIRDEVIYTAPEDADVGYLVDQGTLIKSGSRVINIELTPPAKDEEGRKPDKDMMAMLEGQKETVREDSQGISQRKGVVSYTIDGYEEMFSPATMTELKQEAVLEVKDRELSLERAKAAKGEPLYKICSNSVWYITFWIDKADISRYEAGKNLTVLFGEDKERVSFTVNNVIESEDGWQIILRTNRYYSDFTGGRIHQATVLTTDVKGILISNRCLTTKDDVVGVYRKTTGGDYEFVPVRVLASDGEVTAVTGDFYYDSEGQMVKTVEVYDEVLSDPEVD